MTEPLVFDRINPFYRGWAEDYLHLAGFDPAAFLAAPQPAEDEMFFKALLPNFEGDRGIGAFKFVEATMRHYQALDQIVRQAFGGFDGVTSLLDFASGYGRLTRALGIDRRLYGHTLWEPPLQILDAPPPPEPILVTPRIGITRCADWPLRFLLAPGP